MLRMSNKQFSVWKRRKRNRWTEWLKCVLCKIRERATTRKRPRMEDLHVFPNQVRIDMYSVFDISPRTKCRSCMSEIKVDITITCKGLDGSNNTRNLSHCSRDLTCNVEVPGIRWRHRKRLMHDCCGVCHLTMIPHWWRKLHWETKHIYDVKTKVCGSWWCLYCFAIMSWAIASSVSSIKSWQCGFDRNAT